MAKLKKWRRFNGKLYRYVSSVTKKPTAKKWQKKQKQKWGDKVRIVKHKGAYSLYKRSK